MFESDDFDQILSQIDLPDPWNKDTETNTEKRNPMQSIYECLNNTSIYPTNGCVEKLSEYSKENINENIITKSPKHFNIIEEYNQKSLEHSKRKLINSYFDHKSKRKFPGPAGLLHGTFEDSKEDDICQLELLSQDIDYSQTYLHKGIFESPLWLRLLEDSKGLVKVDSIQYIKQQALEGNLRHQKAEAITAYVESVDRSAIDPLIVLRDMSESIKCTLHRDAWAAFSPYIVSECCALVLCNPTVLTTGSAFKRHYLNITLSNIHSVYSAAILKDKDESIPAGFTKVHEEDFTIIRKEKQYTRNNDYTGELFEDSNCLDGLESAFSVNMF